MKPHASAAVLSPVQVLAVEFKVNLLRPAVGPLLVAEASVLRAGRTLVVSQINVSAIRGGEDVLVAAMMQTNFRVRPAGG